MLRSLGAGGALPSVNTLNEYWADGIETDGLPEGDRWSIWDQTENLVPNDGP